MHRIAQNEPEHTLPVFVQNNSLPAFDKGKVTHWLTGRSIIVVSVPREPLPKFIQVEPFKASVYHREQKNVLREEAAGCRNCLQKGQHKTAD